MDVADRPESDIRHRRTCRSLRLGVFLLAALLLGAALPAQADPPLASCVQQAGDGDYVRFDLYGPGSATLRGRASGRAFTCPLQVERIGGCGPDCRTAPRVDVRVRFDPAACEAGRGPPAPVARRANLRIEGDQARLFARTGASARCDVIAVDPIFAEAMDLPAAPATPAPIDLGAYLGWYPHEAVGGLTLYAHPAFERALDGLQADAALRAMVQGGVVSPIARSGGHLVVAGCEAHTCLARQWWVRTAPDGSQASACMDLPTAADGARWYRTGAAPQQRPERCPVPGD